MKDILSRTSTKITAVIAAIVLLFGATTVAVINTGPQPLAVAADSITLSVTPGNNSAALSWTPLTNAAKYNVRRNSTCSNFKKISTVTAPKTTYNDTSVTNGQKVCYAITGIRTDGTKLVSNKVLVTIGASATASVSVSASVSASASASATTSPSTTASPTATPVAGDNTCSTPGAIVGYGSSTIGGRGGQVFNVSTISALRSAVGTSGPRIINMSPGLYDLGGSDLAISKPNITINGNGAVTKRGSVKITTNQVIISNLKSRSGDESPVAANDVDSFTLNGNSAPRDHIVLDHVEGIWGPDVSTAMLGRVTDVTIQCSILGEGLFHSRHTESQDADGHSLAFNIASEDPTSAPERVTIYGVLFTTSQSRQPRIIGGAAVDIIDSVFYNYAEGPQGNAESLNIIGCTWKKGPAPASAGIPFTSLLWRYQPGGHGAFTTRFDNRVFIGEKQVIGFTPANPTGDDAAVLRSTPLVVPSVDTIGPVAAYNMVRTYSGAVNADSTTDRLRSNLTNGTGVYFNGVGEAPPNPTW